MSNSDTSRSKVLASHLCENLLEIHVLLSEWFLRYQNIPLTGDCKGLLCSVEELPDGTRQLDVETVCEKDYTPGKDQD